MFAKQKWNQYTRLLNKVNRAKADIAFLKQCRKNNVFPSFMRINCNINNSRTKRVLAYAKRFWLKCELQFHHSTLDKAQLELYDFHLNVSKKWKEGSFGRFIAKQSKIIETSKKNFKKKRAIQNRKLHTLIEDQREIVKSKVEVKEVSDLVINLSTAEFSDEEMKMLNKGLNYTPNINKPNIEQAVVDIESAIQYKCDATKERVRKAAKKVIKKVKSTRTLPTQNNDIETIKKLKEKDVYYMKSDKGNKTVIMDKTDYDERMRKSIDEDGYTVLNKSPLETMKKDATLIIRKISNTFDVNKFKLIVSNPQVPKMYGLPKVHKSGDKMRTIVSFNCSPLMKISKWLVADLKQYGRFESASVLNTYDFVDKAKQVEIGEDESIVSFDVQALFPSIPVDIAIESLKEHLQKHNVEEEKMCVYLEAATICMSHNCFVFRDIFYKKESGTSMGNPLSPLIAEAFMSKFENDLKAENLLPRVWYRYIDDVFSIIPSNTADIILETLNNRYDTIKFTVETEDENNSLPFLDVRCKRVNNKVEFEVYRKHTSTDRYITNDSFCSYQHKIAAFHSMAYRLCNLPLSVAAFKQEFDHIVHIADVNGFDKALIEKIVMKQSNKISKNRQSTLFSQNHVNKTTNLQRVSFSYIPAITNQLRKVFEKTNIDIVYNSNSKLRNILGSTKDVTPTSEKCGIYEISCLAPSCLKYVGLSRRAISTRYKEHHSAVRLKYTNKSAVAHHIHVHSMFDEDNRPHRIGTFDESVRLLKHVHNERHLDAFESLYIYKLKQQQLAMNLDDGAIISPLFALV